jgi:hypothetical protein
MPGLDNVGSLTSHNPTGLRGQLPQGLVRPEGLGKFKNHLIGNPTRNLLVL